MANEKSRPEKPVGSIDAFKDAKVRKNPGPHPCEADTRVRAIGIPSGPGKSQEDAIFTAAYRALRRHQDPEGLGDDEVAVGRRLTDRANPGRNC